ncbi:MAG: ATP-binding protein [Planctomycetaceae bacterium]|nr:ATP-binding protein [Planctomycetaceae bacterium]
MTDGRDARDLGSCRRILRSRLAEPAPGRIQVLAGPRQVGKTTLLLSLAEEAGPSALYHALDGPGASLPGSWERLWTRAAEVAATEGRCLLLLDEVHLLGDWAALLKGAWDRLRRKRIPVHVVATGSSALRVSSGSRESLAGRFERLTLSHWSAASLSSEFGIPRREAALLLVLQGSYPGAVGFRKDLPRWSAYVRDAILEPAIGRDLLALGAVRKPALLRQVFAACAASPARILSIEKIRGLLADRGALETVAHYLHLLEEAFLVAGLPKFPPRVHRRRAAPPKILLLDNALSTALDPAGPPDPEKDRERFGALVENACLAHARNRGQSVSWWREEPLEVDGVIEGSWGRWVLEVKTGPVRASELRGLLEFHRRNPGFKPMLVGEEPGRAAAEEAGVPFRRWDDFLLGGPGG